MPRFVLLYHQCPRDYKRPSHWDLMLEAEGILRTWALSQLPRAWQTAYEQTVASYAVCPPPAVSNTVDAEALADHRLAYLDYEGPISGERGTVTRVEAGTYETRSETHDRWEIGISSPALGGRVTLVRKATSSSGWQLSYRPEPNHHSRHATPQ